MDVIVKVFHISRIIQSVFFAIEACLDKKTTKQVEASSSWICPVIDNEFHNNTVRVAMEIAIRKKKHTMSKTFNP